MTRLTEDLPARDQLVALYESVGWTNYTRDAESLQRAIRNSTWTLSAYDGEQLIGLARVVSDDVSIAYLQDILVRPDGQRRGLGRTLLQAALDRFAHVRQWMLLTDDKASTRAFYDAMGFADVARLERHRLVAYARHRDVDLA